MNSMLSKIEKKDIIFLGVLALFAVVSVFRFFDRVLITHSFPFGIMKQYEFAKIVTVLYGISMFVFYYICLMKCQLNNKKNMYYMIMFISVFTFPMFLNQNYFGTLDVYAWIILFSEVICIVLNKFEWISIVFTFVMTIISPVTFFYCECIALVLFLYQYIQKKKKKYLFIFLVNSLIGIAGFVIKFLQNSLIKDTQVNLSLTQFMAMLLCMSPYVYFAFEFFKGLFKNCEKNKWMLWGSIILGVLPSVVINLYIQDFARVIFYVFTYFIAIVMSLIVMNDIDVILQIEIVKEKIKKWIPLPIIFIVYPLLFMTFWIAGPLEVMVENF